MQLPSIGSREPNKVSVATDATAIREKLLLPLLDDGKDVILLMHSYGGCSGAAAAKGLGKHDSTANGRGSIVRLIFLAAFLAREGDSLLSALQGKFDPWVEINDETGQLDVIDPAHVFYHDVPEQKRAKAVENLQLHSRVALSTPSPPSAWADSEFNGRRAYIRALDDRAIVPIAQEMMVKHSGVEWDYREMDSSHSPFLSQPENLTKVILDIISRF